MSTVRLFSIVMGARGGKSEMLRIMLADAHCTECGVLCEPSALRCLDCRRANRRRFALAR